MKILISDYPDSMMPTHEYEKEILMGGLDNPEIKIYDYSDEKKDEFIELLKEADALLTAFIPLGEEILQKVNKLKIISLNATGYDNVDLDEANKKKIAVSPVGEYCTIDVAEFTIGLLISLVKELPSHINNINNKNIWQYDAVRVNKRINELTLGIIGLGRIGQAVARRAKLLGMRVVANDINPNYIMAQELGVELLPLDDLLEQSDIVSNHMNLNDTNIEYFNSDKFDKMKQGAYFINTGRGKQVVEKDLEQALDKGILAGAALDVLEDETPALSVHQLVNRSNVIITPHAAFSTQTSLKELQRISSENIVHYLNGRYDNVFKLVTDFKLEK